MQDTGGIIILADIEGSSGCFDRAGAQWLTQPWIQACRDMTLDIRAVVEALASIGELRVTVADFHRTAFNLFADALPAWVRLRQGYRAGVVPGIGNPPAVDRAFFLGMHAASGTDGVLAHTLTSKFLQLTVNGRPLAEIELFAGSLGACGIRPALFSGCPMACEQARERIPGMPLCPVPARPLSEKAKAAWRCQLAEAAIAAAQTPLSEQSILPPPYQPTGPFRVRYRWAGADSDVTFTTTDFAGLYDRLLEIAYYPGLPTGFLPLGLRLYKLLGRAGLAASRAWWGS